MKENFRFINAKWIWIDSTSNNQYADFVCDFDYQSGEAFLAVSSKTDYAVWLNGQYVHSGQYGDFPEMKSVDVLPITSLLKPGKNRLSLIGWSLNENTFTRIADGHGVIFEIVVDGRSIVSSDEQILARESREYISGNTYLLTPQLGPIYEYVFSEDWKCISSPLDGFAPATLVDDDARFFKRPVKRLTTCNIENAKTITRGSYVGHSSDDLSECLQKAYLSKSDERGNVFTADENADGVYFIVDLQKESSGFLHFHFETESPCNVYVTFGEHLTDLRVRHKIARRNFLLIHKNLNGNCSFTSYLRKIGCRYLQFFITTKKVTVLSATLISTIYPQKMRKLRCKDPLLHEIQNTAVNTLVQCMHEHYEDCPWREQAQYGMDSFIQILSGFYAFKNKEFVAASLRLFGHELNAHGFLNITTPCRVDGFIPVFSLAFILGVCAYTDFYHDLSVFKDVKSNIRSILENFLSYMDKNGVVKQIDAWNFYEWTDGLHHYDQKDSYHAPLNFFLVKTLRDIAVLFQKTGDQELAEKYRKLSAKLRRTAHKLFWDEEKKLYVSYCFENRGEHYAEYTQSVAIFTGIPNKKQAERLCKTLTTKNDLIKVSLSNYLFKYCALLNTSERYRNFVVDEIKRVWGKMLFAGATAFWETEQGESDFGNAGSLCHGWSALPLYILNKYNLTE